MSESLTSSTIDSVTLRGYELLREDSGYALVEDSGFIEFRGEDRKAWLQGQATNDVRRLDVGASLPFCLCTATGQVLAPCHAWAERDRYLVSTPRTVLNAALQRARSMIIMEDVDADD